MGLFRQLGRRVEMYKHLIDHTVTELSNARCSECGAVRPGGNGACPNCSHQSPHEVLGIDPDAPEAVVQTAARERIKTAHPDHGGSATELQRVKQARDRLLDS
jgi:predicted ATP-dependent serine protease